MIYIQRYINLEGTIGPPKGKKKIKKKEGTSENIIGARIKFKKFQYQIGKEYYILPTLRIRVLSQREELTACLELLDHMHALRTINWMRYPVVYIESRRYFSIPTD